MSNTKKEWNKYVDDAPFQENEAEEFKKLMLAYITGFFVSASNKVPLIKTL